MYVCVCDFHVCDLKIMRISSNRQDTQSLVGPILREQPIHYNIHRSNNM